MAPAPKPASSQPLSTQICALPKHDKSAFIQSYVRDQKSFARVYAEQGRERVEAWHAGMSMVGEMRPRPEDMDDTGFGFGTPMLKPRADVKEVKDSNPAPRRSSADSKNETETTRPSARTKKAGKRTSENKEKAAIEDERNRIGKENHAKAEHVKQTKPKELERVRSPSPEKSKSKKSKKRPTAADACSDGEHAARLAERRERKRAKRAIVDPKDSEDEVVKEKKGRGSKKTKIPAGLALLHGFNAPNVGKHRLTVKPMPTIGVFNKGKASAKTPVTKGRHKSTIFSEHAFLSKTATGKTKRPHSPDSTSASDESDSTVKLMKKRSSSKRATKTKMTLSAKMKKRKQDTDSEHSDEDSLPEAPTYRLTEIRKPQASQSKNKRHEETSSEISANDTSSTPHEDRGRQESEVWDIEREDYVLPSQAPVEEPMRDPSTIILDASRFAKANEPANDGTKRQDDDAVSMSRPASSNISLDNACPRDDSLSLGPSESASQVFVRRAPQKPSTSKYFEHSNPVGRTHESIKPARNSDAKDAPAERPRLSKSASADAVAEKQTRFMAPSESVPGKDSHSRDAYDAPIATTQDVQADPTILTRHSNDQFHESSVHAGSHSPNPVRYDSAHYETASEFQWLIEHDDTYIDGPDDSANYTAPSSEMVCDAPEDAYLTDQPYFPEDDALVIYPDELQYPLYVENEEEDHQVPTESELEYGSAGYFELQDMEETLPDSYYFEDGDDSQCLDSGDPTDWGMDGDDGEVFEDAAEDGSFDDGSNMFPLTEDEQDEDDSSIYGYFEPDRRMDDRQVMSTRFFQGRELLTGISGPLSEGFCGDADTPFLPPMDNGSTWSVSVAEADVAKRLRNHWLPQRH